MTVRAGSPDTGAVCVMDRVLVFLVNKGFHFMTGDTEFLGVTDFQSPVEPAPGYDAQYDADKHQKSQAMLAGWGLQVS